MTMKRQLLVLSSLLVAMTTSAQDDWYLSSQNLSGISARNIGPATTSGRIADLAINPNDHDEYYVAAASGGVWKTTNHGVTYRPIFDGQGSYSIGCITIDPNNTNVVWVGTGENNNQRSVAYGDGLYKSEDGGNSWTHIEAMRNSEHIGMIAVDPRNSDIVYVAAYGPLWSAGGDRGLYKTTDGGDNWTKILDISEHTGVNEVHLDPRNPDVIYATSHQRRRHVYTYISGGPESAIYKSTDGGASFDKLSRGLPSGDVGRIGMDISPVNPDVLYACIEGHGFYRSDNRGASWSKMSGHETSGNYYVEIFASPHDLNTVYSMDTYAQFTTDGGRTFNRVPESGKHVDNHAMWIDPNDANHFLMGCDGGLYETWDNASTWHFKPNLPITQFYRVTADRSEPFYYVYGGTQDNFSLGGPSRTTHDRGIVNSDWFVTNTGDGFESQIDPVDPNIVYAQAQYGWLVRFDKASGETMPIKPDVPRNEPPLRWNWDAPLIISPHDHNTLYFAANRVFKSTNRGDEWNLVSPDLSQQIDRNTLPVMGQVWSMDAIAKNKSTTIYGNIVSLAESPLTKGVLMAGTDDGLIQISTDDGANWTKHSSFPGVPANTYVNDLEPSLHNADRIYAVFNNHKNGDFKPYVMRSDNMGRSWTNIGSGLPERGSVYTIVEDHEDPNLLFVGTEFGVFFTNDGGDNWKQISAGMPTIAIRDLDIQREENDLVMASFGRGFYILDDYSPLRHMNSEVFESDAHIFPIEDGLVFQQSNPLGYGAPGFLGASYYMAENPPIGATITYYIAETAESPTAARRAAEKDMEVITYPSADDIRAEDRYQQAYLTFVIRDAEGNEIRRVNTADQSGVRRWTWDGQYASTSGFSTRGAPITNGGTIGFAPEGTYSVQIYRTVNGETEALSEAVNFELKHLNNATITGDDQEINEFQIELNAASRDLNAANTEVNRQREMVTELEAVIRNTPGADMNLLGELRTIDTDLAYIIIELRGDASLTRREFETTTDLNSILGIAAWGSSASSASPNQTQRRSLETVQTEVAAILTSLRASAELLNGIKQQAYQAGAPYIEGDIPQGN